MTTTTQPKGIGGVMQRSIRGRAKGGETSPRAIIFLVALWFCLLSALLFLSVLLITIWIDGQGRLDSHLFIAHPSSNPDDAGARPAILGSLWVIGTTAVMTLPFGIASAIHLEEFADKKNWINRAVELNVQNLAAIPSVIYGMLTLAALGLFGVVNKNQVWVGALALSMLILPVIIIATREALRAVPAEIREGSLALGATPLQTVFRNTLPAALPGIATGAILGLSRALGEAAPLLLLGGLVFLRFDPNRLMSGYTTMPIQIFNWTGRPQAGFHELAAATSIVLLVVLLAMNALAIYIRNRYQQRW